MATIQLCKSVIIARLHGLLRLRPATSPVRLDCLGAECGLCCKVFGGSITLSEREENRLVQIGAAALDVQGAVVLGHKGSCCSHLQGNLCTIYMDRPRSCQEYPWYSINGSLYFDKGCPGIKNDIDGRPEPSALIPFEVYIRALPRTLQVIVTWLIRNW